jgi:membrane-bound lytic murein transglycosylase D
MKPARWSLALWPLVFAAPSLAQPPEDSAVAESDAPAGEELSGQEDLEALEAVEAAVLGRGDFEGPDPREHAAYEGLAPAVRALAIRAERLDWELGSAGRRTGTPRPGGGPGGATAGGGGEGLDIPVVMNPAVERFLDFLQGPGRKWFERWLARTTRYYPLMRPILKKHGLPEDLVVVALVESGLHYAAYSHAHASGPWQFIKATGERYGLKADFWLDERRDFLKATDAAARYLKDLHARFGDWMLAWAAYNTGEGAVERALKRSGAEDFWGLLAAGELAEETRRYVPKIVAAAIISRNPERYGFSDLSYLKPLEWEEVQVKGMVDLKAAARAVGGSLEELKELNPELRFWCSPPHLSSYALRIPRGSAARFHKGYSPSTRDGGVTFTRHTLRQGETLSHVALTHKTSIEALLSANRITDPRRVRAGKALIVPIQPCGTPVGAAAVALDGPGSKRAKNAAPPRKPALAPARHTVRSGENLWSIARKHGILLDDLRRLNGLPPDAPLQPGQVLKLR